MSQAEELTLSEAQVRGLTTSELLAIIQLPEGMEGLRYLMSMAQKVSYILTHEETVRLQILADARARQIEHHGNIKRKRKEGIPGRAEAIEQKLGGMKWRYIAEIEGIFQDFVTGRQGKLGHVLEDVQSGTRVTVLKSTMLEARDRLGIVSGYPLAHVKRVAREAVIAGEVTAGALRSGLAALRG